MMKNFFPKILTTAALCLAAGLLLNSCMISNIGGTIRDMGEEKTAVDTNNPVGGVVYRKKLDLRLSGHHASSRGCVQRQRWVNS